MITSINELIWPDGVVRSISSVFPVTVTITEAGEAIGPRFNTCKVTLAQMPGEEDDPPVYAVIAWHSSADGIVEIVKETITQDLIEAPHARAVLGESGRTIRYDVEGGCGCGSSLKTFRPWKEQAVVMAIRKPASLSRS